MASYCNSTDSQAAINLAKDGKPFQVAINSNLPITIICKNIGINDGILVDVTYSFYRTYSISLDGAKSTATRRLTTAIKGIKTQKPSPIYQYYYGKDYMQQIAIYSGSWIVVQDVGAGSGYFYNVSIDSIVPVNPGINPTPKGVMIKDKNGSIIYDDNTIDCTWDVICGGGCPEGFCKCVTPGYPGYCCLDCNSISNQIAEITSQVKSINRST